MSHPLKDTRITENEFGNVIIQLSSRSNTILPLFIIVIVGFTA